MVALPQSDDTKVIAQVLWVDRYGNAQLNVGPDDLPDQLRRAHRAAVCQPHRSDGRCRAQRTRAASFAARSVGGAVGLVLDSSGLLAVAMDQRSAADELGLAAGDQVTLSAVDADAQPGTTQPVSLRPSR